MRGAARAPRRRSSNRKAAPADGADRRDGVRRNPVRRATASLRAITRSRPQLDRRLDVVHRAMGGAWWPVPSSAGLGVGQGLPARQPLEGYNVRCTLVTRFSTIRRTAEAGMTTAEYAVGTLAACAFAGVLLAVVRSGTVKSALASVIAAALGSVG